MRLIDADELIKDRVENDPVRIAAMCTPTAYDVDGVVERLKEKMCSAEDELSDLDCANRNRHFKDAIEIVKAGMSAVKEAE